MNKKEVERTVLILEKQYDKECVIGFCRNEYKLIRIRMQVDKSFEVGDILSFLTQKKEGLFYFPFEQSINIRNAEARENITLRDGNLEIETNLAFSANPSHLTHHHFKIGFSDLYGFLFIRTDQRNLRHNVIYKAVIKIFQCHNENEPVFQTITDLHEDKEFQYQHQFLETMLHYENSGIGKEMNLANGIHPARNNTYNRQKGYNAPNNRNRSNTKNPYYTGNNPKYEMLNKQARSSYRRMLVTKKYETERNGSYGQVFSELGDADLETLCDIGGQITLNVGDWFMGSLQYHKFTQRYGVDKIERKIDDVPEVRVDNHGNIFASFELDLRGVKPYSEQYTIIPILYLVKVLLRGKDYNFLDMRIDAEFVKMAKPFNGDVYWEFVSMLDEVPHDMPYYEWKQNKVSGYEPVQTRFVPPDFDDFEDDFSDPDDEIEKLKEKEKRKPFQSPQSNERKNDVHDQWNTQNFQDRDRFDEGRYPSTSMSNDNYYGRDSRRSSSQFSSNTRFEYEKPKQPSRCEDPMETGVVVFELDKYMFVIYSYQRDKAILLKNKNVHLGDFVKFYSKRIGRQVDYCDYEVTEFVEIVDLPSHEVNPVFVEGKYADVSGEVNLSEMHSIYAAFGYTVFRSDEFKNVFAGENVEHSSDPDWNLKKLKSTFLGQPSARSIYCRCRFVLGDVPLSFVDKSDWHDKNVRAYHWKLVSVEGTRVAVEESYAEQKRRNIPESLKDVEEDDDIARTKKLNKERANGFEREPLSDNYEPSRPTSTQPSQGGYESEKFSQFQERNSSRNIPERDFEEEDEISRQKKMNKERANGFEREPMGYQYEPSRPTSTHPVQGGYDTEKLSQFQERNPTRTNSINGRSSSGRFAQSSSVLDEDDDLQRLSRENKAMKDTLRNMLKVNQRMQQNKVIRETVKIQDLELYKEWQETMSLCEAKRNDRSSPSSSIGSKSRF